MGVFHEFSAWGVKFDLASVPAHSPALSLPGVIIISSVVILAQHGQIRGVRLAAILMGVYVVDLAPIGRYAAVRPWADKIFCRCQDALFQRCESGLVEIHRAGGWVEETGIEFVTKCSFDEFRAGHRGAVGETNHDFISGAAGYFREIIKSDGDNRPIFGAKHPAATFDMVPESIQKCV